MLHSQSLFLSPTSSLHSPAANEVLSHVLLIVPKDDPLSGLYNASLCEIVE